MKPKITDRADIYCNGLEVTALLELFNELYCSNSLPKSLNNLHRHIAAVEQTYPSKPNWNRTHESN
jgi:hypothetical protein